MTRYVRVTNPAEAGMVLGLYLTHNPESTPPISFDKLRIARYPWHLVVDLRGGTIRWSESGPGAITCDQFCTEARKEITSERIVVDSGPDSRTTFVYADGRVVIGCKDLPRDVADMAINFFKANAKKVKKRGDEMEKFAGNGMLIRVWYNTETNDPRLSIDYDGAAGLDEVLRLEKIRAAFMKKHAPKPVSRKSRK